MNDIILPDGTKTVPEGLKTIKKKEVERLNARFMKYTEEGTEKGMDNYPTIDMTMNETFDQYAKGLVRLTINTGKKKHIFFIKEDAIMSMIFTANDSASQLASMIREDKALAMEQLRQEAEREEFKKNISE